MAKEEIKVGQEVYWYVASTQLSGTVMEIQKREDAIILPARLGKHNDRVVVIRFDDGIKIRKFESDVNVLNRMK